MIITFKCFIFCLIQTKIHHASTNVYKFINSPKYSYISIHGGCGIMMMYDIHMHLTSFNTIIIDLVQNVQYQLLIFIHKKKHIVCVHRIHSCSIFTFLNNFQTIIQHFPERRLIISMEDYYLDILKDNNQAKIIIIIIKFHGQIPNIIII